MTWLSKKQNFISLSTIKTEYILAGSCCTQLLWMKQMLKDYGIEFLWMKQLLWLEFLDKKNSHTLSKIQALRYKLPTCNI